MSAKRTTVRAGNHTYCLERKGAAVWINGGLFREPAEIDDLVDLTLVLGLAADRLLDDDCHEGRNGE